MMTPSSERYANENPLYGVAVGAVLIVVAFVTFSVPIVGEAWLPTLARQILAVVFGLIGAGATVSCMLDWVRMGEQPETWG